MERQLEVERIVSKLKEIQKQDLVINHPERLSPFAFPLWAESLRTQVSTESWSDRVSRMAEELEQRAEILPCLYIGKMKSFTSFRKKLFFWEEQKTLFVADPHFGKATVFRKAGIPITEKTTQDDLNKLSEIIRLSGSKRIIFLGDFLHARQSRTQVLRNLLYLWREDFPDLELHFDSRQSR